MDIKYITENYNIIYGPYKRADGRMHIVVYNSNTRNKKTISYPKYILMQNGYDISEDCHVHHIDGDYSNNSIDNLQIVENKDHMSYHKKYEIGQTVTLTCSFCGNDFEIDISKLRYRFRKNRKNVFCSRNCSGNYYK